MEGAIAASLFVLMFGGLYSAVGFGSAKLNVMEETRKSTWQSALDACQDDEHVFGGAQEQVLSDVGSEQHSSEEAYADMASQAETSGNYVTLATHASFSNSGLVGGQLHKLSYRMHTRCNENVQNDDLWEVITDAIGAINPL